MTHECVFCSFQKHSKTKQASRDNVSISDITKLMKDFIVGCYNFNESGLRYFHMLLDLGYKNINLNYNFKTE